MLPDEGANPAGIEPFPLSGQGLRNWLNTAGQALFTEFSSGADLLSFLRDNGVAIRTQDFYTIRNTVLDRQASILNLTGSLSDLQGLNPDSLVPLGYTIFDSGYELSDAFLYRFSVDSVNPLTGETGRTFMAIASDRQLTFNEAMDQMSTMFTGEYTAEGQNVTEINLDAAFGNPLLQ